MNLRFSRFKNIGFIMKKVRGVDDNLFNVKMIIVKMIRMKSYEIFSRSFFLPTTAIPLKI